MNERFEDLMYQAGLTAQGSWDSMDSYDQQAIKRFAELIVRDCALTAGLMEHEGRKGIGAQILDNYGIKNDHHALDIMVAENQRLGLYDD